MTLSDACDVQQQNDPTTVVTWNYYEVLCDNFQRQLGATCDPIADDI
jgi:hypothetical protein